MAIKTFTAGSVLTASDTNTYLANSGLVYIDGTTFTTTANPFINGCFSSNYENYQIVVLVEASTPVNLTFRVRSGTSTPETGAVYDRFGFWFTGGGTIQSLILANQTSALLTDVTNVGGNRSAITINLFGPNTPRPTIANTQSWDSNSGAVYFPSYRIETNTAYTGIELVPSSGNLTGSMRVYGYRQA